MCSTVLSAIGLIVKKREGGRERALTLLYSTVLNAVGLNVRERERERERGRERESLNPIVLYCAECSRVKCKEERERERALTLLYSTVLNTVGLNVKKEREREIERET